jgi:putative aminopeptidase FrvX
MVAALLGVLLFPSSLLSQTALDSLVLRLSAMTAVSGYERAMADTVLKLLPEAERDRAGNILLTLGSGEPRRLLACALDEPGYVIGGIRPDGYLTLRRVGPNPGPLFDQQLEGQRVRVWGRRGGVPGVVAVRSVHLTRGRSGLTETPFTFDDALVDVGAASAAEVARLGIEVLSPVALEKRPHRYADSLVAAPSVARRAGCAALLDAARGGATPAGGTVVVAFLVEQAFTQRGLLSVARNLGPFTRTALIDRGSTRDLVADRPAPDPRLGAFEVWLLPSRYGDTAVETISLNDVAALRQGLMLRIQGAE